MDNATQDAEVWKPIPSCEGLYEASSLGQIRRVGNRIIKPGQIWSGYEKISVSIRGVVSTRAVHSLVCEAFHGSKPTPMHEVSHLNGIRNDNRPDNLQWKTHTENESDKRKHGTLAVGKRNGAHTKPHRVARGLRNWNAKMTPDTVALYRSLIETKQLSINSAAKLAGISKSSMGSIARRETWAHI